MTAKERKEQKLRALAARFTAFHGEFSDCFQTKTRDNSEISKQYLNGLVQSPKANMERMEENVPDANEQSLQHFVTNSPWDEKAVVEKVATEGNKLLGGKEDSCLLIDESAIPKKGKKSVGVSRQYCGRMGKTENCQVGVFAALGCGDRALPVDFRLYLPKEWIDDPARCDVAGIPADKRVLKSKAEMALEMVKDAKSRGLKFNWVGADAGYGHDSKFSEGVAGLGLTYVVDVLSNRQIFLEFPKLVTQKGFSVEKWTELQPESEWKTCTLRASTKGAVIVEVLHQKVWIKTNAGTRAVRLLVRRMANDKADVKYSISNAGDEISVERLAYMQGQRYWIERTFEDLKSVLGMGEYQLRKWRGWHHHMSLVLMAHLFLLRERVNNAKDFPLLSCRDVIELLEFYLPKRAVDEDEVFRQMEKRHEKRRKDIERNE